jgi:polynucleotide 5'-hydroxyl-kinase GRC3/NOL9
LHSRIIGIKASQTLLVKGPAKVIALQDGMSAISKIVNKNEKVIVRKGKLLPFETIRNVKVELHLWNKSNYLIAEGGVGVKIWKPLINHILNQKSRKILIIGSTDSGKSTLSAYIINNMFSKQHLTGIIDEDLGQGDIAPPGCIGGKIIDKPIFDLRDTKADFFGFIGDITPRKIESILLNQVRRIRDILERMSVDFYIVNTDGFIDNEGYFLKVELIKEMKPDLVVCFEDVRQEKTLFERLRKEVGNSIILAKRSEYSGKTSIDRTEGRMSQYRRFIGKGHQIHLDLSELNICFLGSIYHSTNDKSNKFVLVKEDNGRNKLVFHSNFCNYVEILKEGLKERSLIGIYSLLNMFVGLGLSGNVMHFGKIIKIYPDFSVDVSTSSGIAADTLFLSLIKIRTYSHREYRLPIIVNSV